ncbi:MAG TPA: hypothetical protein PKJ63_00405 [Cyclobacteriaceae bacterium]|nr:hypothetical protein [Cyclobacteriaceae bacterium]
MWAYSEYGSHAKMKVAFLAGLTESTLVSARLKDSGGKSNVLNDFQRIDFRFIVESVILMPFS